MLLGRGAGPGSSDRHRERLVGTAIARDAVPAVSVALHRWPGLLVVPMGLTAARNRLPGDISRKFKSNCAAISVAAVSSDVFVGRREADQPRSGMARLDGAGLPLHDAAASRARVLVLPPVAARVPASLDFCD